MHFDYFLILDAKNWQSLFPWPYQGYSLVLSLFFMKETKVPNPHFDKILPFIFYSQRVYRSEERIGLFTKFFAQLEVEATKESTKVFLNPVSSQKYFQWNKHLQVQSSCQKGHVKTSNICHMGGKPILKQEKTSVLIWPPSRGVGLFANTGYGFYEHLSKLLFQPKELSFRFHMTNLCPSKLAHNIRHLGQLLHSRVQKDKDFGRIKIPCKQMWLCMTTFEKG